MRKKRGIPVAPPRLPSFDGPNNLGQSSSSIGQQHSSSTTNLSSAGVSVASSSTTSAHPPPRLLGPTSLDTYDPGTRTSNLIIIIIII